MDKPKYIVTSGTIGRQFDDPHEAIKWHNEMAMEGVPTWILNLEDYDWDANPMNIEWRDVSEFLPKNKVQ